jgi:hypothetical protein
MQKLIITFILKMDLSQVKPKVVVHTIINLWRKIRMNFYKNKNLITQILPCFVLMNMIKEILLLLSSRVIVQFLEDAFKKKILFNIWLNMVTNFGLNTNKKVNCLNFIFWMLMKQLVNWFSTWINHYLIFLLELKNPLLFKIQRY